MTNAFDALEYVRQLRTIGPEMPFPLAQHIIATGEDAVAPLVALAIDTELLVGAEPRCYAPIHALRLLGEVGTLDAIAPLIHAPIPAAPNQAIEKRTAIWDGELPQVIARIGTTAYEQLVALLDDEHTSNIGHHRAAIALAYLSVAQSDLTDQIVTTLEARLMSADTDRNASVALALANMGVDRSYAVVMQAYKDGHLAKDAVQPGPLRQLLLSKSNARLRCVTHPLDERYAHHPLTPTN